MDKHMKKLIKKAAKAFKKLNKLQGFE